MIELAAEHGYDELPTTDPAELADVVPRRRQPPRPRPVPRDVRPHGRRDAARATRSTGCARECAEDLADDGVVYAEVRFAPELHLEAGLTLDEVVEAVLEGFDAGQAGARHRRSACSSRPCGTRRNSGDRRAAPSATATRAWSASTSPAPRPATRRPATSTRSSTSQRTNFHITIHAGEAFGLPSIWEALQFCGAERLGHGVRIVDDITVRRRRLGAARPAGQLRARPAGAARDVPDVERPHRRVRHDRGAPDRAAVAAALPGHGQHRQPAHEQRLDDRARWPAWSTRSATAGTTSSGSPSTP